MKKLLIIILLFVSFNIFGANYSTTKTGSWIDNTVWGAIYPNSALDNATISNNDSIWITSDITIGILTFKNNSILYIAPNVTLTVDSISILQNAKLYVEGTLSVIGGISMANNSNLDIDLGGSIDIGGDLTAGNGVYIAIDGTMDIDGDMTMGTGSEIISPGGTGSIIVDGTVDIPVGSDPDVIINPTLPITLYDFYVNSNNNNQEIIWITLSEINNHKFLIEYSNDAVEWNYLDEVPGNGNSSYRIEYSYKHYTNISYYYRLTQIDFDGQSETFDYIKYNDINFITKLYNVYNMNGQFLMIGEEEDIKNKLSNGIYIISNETESKKIGIFK